MCGSALVEKSSLSCWDYFSLLNQTVSIVLNAKTAFKVGAVILSMKFLCPEVALHLYKFTIRPCMKYCHVWAGTPNFYWAVFEKPQKQICRTIGPGLASSLEPLAHHRNVVNLTLFCRY